MNRPAAVPARFKNFVLSLAILAPAIASAADDYFPPSDKAGGWRTPKDAAQALKLTGMDVTRLDQAFAYASHSSQHGGVAGRAAWLARL